MKKDKAVAKDIGEFIKGFPKDVQEILIKLRVTISKAAPNATETIKYAIPTFVQDGVNVVHFSAYSTHIGFYPTPSVIIAFKAELSKYDTSKGTVQFPIDKPIPMRLISDMVKFRIAEIVDKKNSKAKKGK